jgi:hypothetical protein
MKMPTDAPSPTAVAEPAWDACERCAAPLDESQRYCVSCGTRRTQADDPATRYFAEAARRARSTSVPAAVAPRSAHGITVAVLLALLPLAAGVGVLVGRGGSGGEERILEALKAQKAPIIQIVGGAGTAAADPAAATAAKSAAKKAKKTGGRTTADGAKVLATGPAGDARQLEGAQPTAKQLSDSADAVKRINSSKGKAYVETQRNLPDQIVIP